jgi:predicted nucleotidyltransferase
LSSSFDAYIKAGERALGQLEGYRDVARRVKEAARQIWKDCRLYVFGSVLDKRYTASSDIDILIVVDGVDREEATRAKARILGAIDAPIELHIVSSGELERWYSRFIDKLEEVR